MAYTLLLSLIEYKTLVMRGDFDAANEILPQIPQVCAPAAETHSSALETRGYCMMSHSEWRLC